MQLHAAAFKLKHSILSAYIAFFNDSMRLKLIDIIIPGNLFLHFIETVALLE